MVGLGWDTFFGGVKKGVEKIGSLPEVKNLTDKAKSEFDNIIGNSTLDIIAITQIIWNPIFCLTLIVWWKGFASPVFGIPSIVVKAMYFRWTEPKTESFSLINCAQQNLKWFTRYI